MSKSDGGKIEIKIIMKGHSLFQIKGSYMYIIQVYIGSCAHTMYVLVCICTYFIPR